MNVGVGFEQRLRVDPFQDRPIVRAKPRQRIAQQVLLPVTYRSDAVHEYEPADAGRIALGGEHRETAAPRVTQNIPRHEAEGFANRREIARVVFDTRGLRSWRSLRCTPTSLVVEDELTALRQGSESGPQQMVIEQQSTVHTHKRYRTVSLRREIHGELEPACANGAPYQARRSRARALKSDEPVAGGDQRTDTAATR